MWLNFCKLCFGLLAVSSLLGCVTSTVKGTGAATTRDEALKGALKDAVQNSNGAYINSEVQLNDGKITKDKLIEFSSGHVDSYKIVKETKSDLGYEVIVEADVSSSNVAKRAFSGTSSPTRGELGSEEIYNKAVSYQNSKNQGRMLLHEILQDYPSRAFDVEIEKPSLKYNDYGSAVYVIPYTVKWKFTYLKALKEAVVETAGDYCTNFSWYRKDCLLDADIMIRLGLTWSALTNNNAYRMPHRIEGQDLRRVFKPDLAVMHTLYNSKNEAIQSYCNQINLQYGGGQSSDKLSTNVTHSKYALIENEPYYPIVLENSDWTASLLIPVVNLEFIKEIDHIGGQIVSKCFNSSKDISRFKRNIRND